jgi:CRISPR-associated protein Csx17
MTTEHHLHGCAPTPLAHYLKALGVLRVVAEQADANARGSWQAEHFVLDTALAREELLQFFLRDYAPSPIISPWNGRAGFLEGDDAAGSSRIGAVLVNTFVRSEAERFAHLREVIEYARSAPAVDRFNTVRAELKPLSKVKQPDESQTATLSALKKEADVLKDNLITVLRATAPDHLLEWIDACVRLGALLDQAPLLGSGGNDGSRDFGVNFAAKLRMLFDVQSGSPQPAASRELEAALFGHPLAQLASDTMGQFAPGQGGPNAGTGFEAQAPLNPWDVVLALEGTLMFAGAVTRRYGAVGKSRAAFPFTFDVTRAGSGAVSAADGTPPRGEFWAPLWNRSVGFIELQTVLTEGRVSLGRDIATDGLDAARALRSFGSQRGIDAFQRYLLLQSDNKMPYQATPVARVGVDPNPAAGLIADLAGGGSWLRRFRRLAHSKEAPARLRGLARRLEDGLFDLTDRKNDAVAVQRVLMALGDAALYLRAANRRVRDAKEAAYVPPPPRLRAQWVRDADDQTPEFRIAAALASLGWLRLAGGERSEEIADDSVAVPVDGAGRTGPLADDRLGRGNLQLPFCVHIVPLDQRRLFTADRHWNEERKSNTPDGAALAVWRAGDLLRNLIAVLERRLMEAKRHGLDDKPLSGRLGVDLGTIQAFITGPTMFDDRRCADLLAGLVWAAPPMSFKGPDQPPGGLPYAYAALKPIFTSDRTLRDIEALSAEGRLPVPPGLLRMLANGRAEQALRVALARARGSRLPIAFGHPSAAGCDPRRLAAALLVPLEQGALRTLCCRAYPPKEPQGDDRNAA